jgi:YVTN family beta-propeller protein
MAATETPQLDLRSMPAEKQSAVLRERYALLKGQNATVQARVENNPARLYISMLESGYRVALKREDGATFLYLWPDGSTPRLGRRGAHSVVAHRDGRIYTNTTENRVVVLDASTRKVTKHIAAGDDPSHLELSHDQRRLYVANSGSNDVTIIDTSIDTAVERAPTGKHPLLPCVAPDRDVVYLPSGPDKTLTVVGGGKRVGTLAVGEAPHDVAASPDGRWVYQPNSGSHTVSVIDTHSHSVIGEIAVGLGPGHIAFSPNSRRAYIANTLSDNVSVVDTANHEVTATIPAGAAAHLPALSHDGRFGYVANFASDDLTVWKTETEDVVARIPVGIYPHFFAQSPDGRWLVVSNTGESSVCLIDALSHRTVARLEVGGAPAHLAFDPDGNCAFVGCEATDEIAVIDLSAQKVVERVKAGAALS